MPIGSQLSISKSLKNKSYFSCSVITNTPPKILHMLLVEDFIKTIL